MRFFARLAYHGGDFHGWQRQPNTSETIQEKIEEALSTIAQERIAVVGCGRTDAGVHAKDYVLHFDSDKDFTDLSFKVNSLLPRTIVFYHIWKVEESSHARFDAISRSYRFQLHTSKNPFLLGRSFYYHRPLDLMKCDEVSQLILTYSSFKPFSKTGSDVKNYECNLSKITWSEISENQYEFLITSNRFLRGMIRLLVGAHLLYNEEKISLKEIQNAMDNQTRMSRSWSVPGEGLFLDNIDYPK